MLLFGYLDILSLVGTNRLNRTGRVDRMDGKRAVSQEFNDNHQGNRQRGRPKNILWNCVEAGITRAELKAEKRGKK
jgi:hypothetical protein